MRTVDEMYNDICNWEMEAGEDFLDYFDSSFNEINFMFWALGKGYMSEDKFHAWEAEKNKNFISNAEILIGDEKYSIVEETENWKEDVRKGYRILAEFLASTTTYQRRVKEFFTDNPV